MSVQRRKSCHTAPSSVFELLFLFTASRSVFCRQGTDSEKGGFPLSHNFYVRTHLNFKGVNKIETVYERSSVNLKVEPRSTFTFYAWPFIHYFYVIYARNFSVRTHVKFSPVNDIEVMYERPRVERES